jgi:hypothetical protein
MAIKKIVGNAAVNVNFTIEFTLTKEEAKALEAIAGYGADPFLKTFYQHMGESYLKPFEKAIRDLFKRITEELPSELYKIEKAEEGITEALKKFS